MSPNWILGTLDPGPLPKWALVCWRRHGEKGFLSIHEENKMTLKEMHPDADLMIISILE
jgi:hypothetical protein